RSGRSGVWLGFGFGLGAVAEGTFLSLLGFGLVAGLGLGFGGWGGKRVDALDLHLEGGLHFGMQAQFNLEFAECLNRVIEVDLSLVEQDVELVLEFVGNGAAGDAAEDFAVIAGLHLEQAGELGDALAQFAHRIELVRLAVGAALAEHFEAALVGVGQRNRHTHRIEIIAGIAGGDFDLIRLGAEPDDLLGKDDFGLGHKTEKVSVCVERETETVNQKGTSSSPGGGGSASAGADAGAWEAGAAPGRGGSGAGPALSPPRPPSMKLKLSRTTRSLVCFWWVFLSSHWSSFRRPSRRKGRP